MKNLVSLLVVLTLHAIPNMESVEVYSNVTPVGSLARPRGQIQVMRDLVRFEQTIQD